MAELRAIVEPLGYRVLAVPMTKALHLKSAVTALPDGTIIGYSARRRRPGVLPALPADARGGRRPRRRPRRRPVLMSAARRGRPTWSPTSGYEPVLVDISEFEKLEGCVTCLSVRLRAAAAPPG